MIEYKNNLIPTEVDIDENESEEHIFHGNFEDKEIRNKNIAQFKKGENGNNS